MKNKLKIYFFCIIILLFSNNFSSADEFTFNASEIIALNDENKIMVLNEYDLSNNIIINVRLCILLL